MVLDGAHRAQPSPTPLVAGWICMASQPPDLAWEDFPGFNANRDRLDVLQGSSDPGSIFGFGRGHDGAALRLLLPGQYTVLCDSVIQYRSWAVFLARPSPNPRVFPTGSAGAQPSSRHADRQKKNEARVSPEYFAWLVGSDWLFHGRLLW
jgi:hypothetical protein